MTEQTPRQPGVDPQELALAQLFDRLAGLGKRIRKQDQTISSEARVERTVRSNWKTTNSANSPSQSI